MGTTTMKKTSTFRRLLVAAALGFTALGLAPSAKAQEILMTGPLAGAPSSRKLRLHREGRIELAPAVNFTLLDEYQRSILVGARLNYNLTDWLAVGVYGGFAGGPLHVKTYLTERIQHVNGRRDADSLDKRLTAVSMGPNFENQLGSIDWIASPQITGVPFRGKLALFKSIYVDTDLYFFAGPAFVGLKERANCDEGACTTNFKRASRVAVAPTFGLGFSFYANKWSAVGLEWRALPFSWNTGGFDTAGGGHNDAFPDNAISSADRQFRFNQLLGLSYNIYFPFEHRLSE